MSNEPSQVANTPHVDGFQADAPPTLRASFCQEPARRRPGCSNRLHRHAER